MSHIEMFFLFWLFRSFIPGDAFDHLDHPVTRVTAADIPVPYAANLEAMAFPTAEVIADAVRKSLYRKK